MGVAVNEGVTAPATVGGVGLDTSSGARGALTGDATEAGTATVSEGAAATATEPTDGATSTVVPGAGRGVRTPRVTAKPVSAATRTTGRMGHH
jgi:hypothetical protein